MMDFWTDFPLKVFKDHYEQLTGNTCCVAVYKNEQTGHHYYESDGVEEKFH